MSAPRVEILARLEEGGQQVVLRRRGSELDVLLGNVVLLSSAALETERAFGRLPHELRKHAPRKVIVGGLGFGATVQGVLQGASGETRVLVVEKLEAMATLLRGPAAALSGGVLDDGRVTLVKADVSDVLACERDVDAVLLDVDNGPHWASFRSNGKLYSQQGVAAAAACLAPGGLYAVWSGYEADGFLPRIRSAGLHAEVIPLRERGVVRARAYVGRAADAPPP